MSKHNVVVDTGFSNGNTRVEMKAILPVDDDGIVAQDEIKVDVYVVTPDGIDRLRLVPQGDHDQGELFEGVGDDDPDELDKPRSLFDVAQSLGIGVKMLHNFGARGWVTLHHDSKKAPGKARCYITDRDVGELIENHSDELQNAMDAAEIVEGMPYVTPAQIEVNWHVTPWEIRQAIENGKLQQRSKGRSLFIDIESVVSAFGEREQD